MRYKEFYNMGTISSRNLKKRAASITKHSSDFRKAVWQHSLIVLGVPLAVFLIQLLLDAAAPSQKGLDGFQTAAIFSTVQSTLDTVCSILLPFWQAGLLYAAIRATRRQDVEFSNLAQGFRRWGVVLRFYILLYLGSMAAVMAITSALSILMTFLAPIYVLIMPAPASMQNFSSESFLTELQKAAEAEDMAAIVNLIPKDTIMYILPLVVLTLLGTLALLLHLYYRIRLSQYLLMDDPAVGARASISLSNRMVKGNKWNLLKLDLSFWWYGLMNAIPVLISTLPMILTLCRISLPVSGTVLTLLCQIVSTVLSLGIVWFFGPYVEATYACAYDELRTPGQTITTQAYNMPNF